MPQGITHDVDDEEVVDHATEIILEASDIKEDERTTLTMIATEAESSDSKTQG